MANPEHVELARQGPKIWNLWKEKNTEEIANFSGIDFSTDEYREITFRSFMFGDGAKFDGTTFGNNAEFQETQFGHEANFEGATFGDDANFERATFKNNANFDNATFGDNTKFYGEVRFGENASFKYATFGNGAKFVNSVFEKYPRFDFAKFGKDGNFDHSRFGSAASFRSVTFGESATFRDSRFTAKAEFTDVVFCGKVYFDSQTELPRINFSRAQFLGAASFVDRHFAAEANFSNAHFAMPPDFRETRSRENLDWTEAKFSFGRFFRLAGIPIRVRGWTTNTDTITRLRRLRGIAKEIHAVDAERDLFILERDAERGILWRDWWRAGLSNSLIGWPRPLIATVLTFLFRYLSNCGRNVLFPVFWLVVSNTGFFFVYEFLVDRPPFVIVKKALLDLTLASAVPFGATARPAFQSAVKVLFENPASARIDIPWQIHAASVTQGITNIVLLFLLGLALRNYFKLR